MMHLVAATALVIGAQGSYDWQDIVQKGFQDATFEAKAVKGVQKELQKINKEFAYSYRFDSMSARVKEPHMLRLESTVDDTKLLYIMNGTKKYFNVGNRLKGTDDVSRAPGKRQTFMDFGILTPSIFADPFKATFVRVDRESGDLVFDLTYQSKYDDTSRHRVWIDKDKRYITKRVWFSQEGVQLATFIYENPKNKDGVWFPTRCTVKNNDDKVAGVTEYTKMVINSGLPDSIFKW
jgi:outer membrane lipoprotein-sorting protein